MIFTFGNYVIDADTEKTRGIYRTLPLISQSCSCDGCRNFEQAVDVLPEPVLAFFRTLGIDPKKMTECYVNCQNADGTLFYGGFCHLCGTLIQGESAWGKTSEASSRCDADLMYHIDDHFCVSFGEACDLVEVQFEAPVLQIEFQADIPWVLDKP